MSGPTIRRTWVDRSDGGVVHAVRRRRRWYLVRQRDGQYRTGCYYAPATAAGLDYVCSGESETWPTLRALMAEVTLDGWTLSELDGEAVRP